MVGLDGEDEPEGGEVGGVVGIGWEAGWPDAEHGDGVVVRLVDADVIMIVDRCDVVEVVKRLPDCRERRWKAVTGERR